MYVIVPSGAFWVVLRIMWLQIILNLLPAFFSVLLGCWISIICAERHRFPSSVLWPKLWVRHCGQSKHTRGLFFHFLFVTSVQGFLAISAAAGGGERKINTLNVMCGQWNKRMIYVGMATPWIRWDLCGRMNEGKEGCWHSDPEKEL